MGAFLVVALKITFAPREGNQKAFLEVCAFSSAMVEQKIAGAACDKKEATERVERRSCQDQRDNILEEASATECEEDGAIDDEEEALADDAAIFFRPLGAKEYAARVASAASLNVNLDIMLNDLQMGNGHDGRATLSRLEAPGPMHSSTRSDGILSSVDQHLVDWSSRAELPPMFAHPKKVDLMIGLSDTELVEDLLLLSGRDLKEERDSNGESPQRAQSTEECGLKANCKVAKPTVNNAAHGVMVTPSKLPKENASTEVAKAAAANLLLKSVATKASLVATIETEAASERLYTPDRAAGGSGKTRRFNVVDDAEPAVSRVIPAAKKQKADDQSMLSDPLLFTKHTEKNGIFVCNKCGINFWPTSRNCNRPMPRHLGNCQGLEEGAGGGESDGVLKR